MLSVQHSSSCAVACCRRWREEQKVDIYAHAMSGLFSLELDPEKQLKYIDFIDIYTAMDDNQMHEYQTRYPQENQKMATLTERLLNEGIQQGMQQGEQNVLQRQLVRRFGPLDSQARQRLQHATAQELECWADNILDARTLDEVFICH